MKLLKAKHPPRAAMLVLVSAFFLSLLVVPSIATAETTDGYVAYLSDREASGSKVGFGSLIKDKDNKGNPLTLLKDGEEVQFDKGLFAPARSAIYYTDIQDYGYERFEAWVGIDGDMRSSKKASVTFQVWGDGKLLWESGPMDAASPAQRVDVDVSGVSVLKLFVHDGDNKVDDHAVWADAKFTKKSAEPYLVVSAKEFASPDQVTDENLLEGVFARTLSGPLTREDKPVTTPLGYVVRNGKEGNDLSDRVKCTTNYKPGTAGTYSVTYSVTDDAGLTRTRTVPLKVRGTERQRLNADHEYLTTPAANFLYPGRDYFDEQGKRAFDYALETLLKVGDTLEKDPQAYPIVTNNGERVYKITVNLYDAGIFMTRSQAGYLTSVLMDNEPRCFHIKDWGTDVQEREGMAGAVTFYMPVRYGDHANQKFWYNNRLADIEKNASRFISNVENGMTDAQRLRAVLEPYKNWIRYVGGGQLMDEALVEGQGVCGGNSRGAIYLAQRIGIKSHWVRTGPHAWSMMKLNDTGAYYRVDLLAYPDCFLSVDGGNYQKYHGHHGEILFNRSLGYPDATLESFPFAHTAWPNLTFKVADGISVLVPSDRDDFDATSLVMTCKSIYDGDLTSRIVVDDGGLEERADADGFKPGYYKLRYTVTDSRGNTAHAEAHVQVVHEGESVVDMMPQNNAGTAFRRVSLWTGTAERFYEHGLLQQEAKSVTYDVADKGFTYLDAWVGINGSVRANTQWGQNGKVQLEVEATVRDARGVESKQIVATSPVMGWYTVRHHILAPLPKGTVAVTLRNVPKGSGNNHAAWGNVRFLNDEILDHIPVPPTVSGVEDGAVYQQGTTVTPVVENAHSSKLYRRDLPIEVNPGTFVSDISASQVDPVSDDVQDWGEEVAGWRSGDPISREGVYTLVAFGEADLTTRVHFQIGEKQVVDPTPPVEPAWEIEVDAEKPHVVYGETITVSVSARDVGLGTKPGMIELFREEEPDSVLAAKKPDAKGVAVFELNTLDGLLPVGETRLMARISGVPDVQSAGVTVTVSAAQPSAPVFDDLIGRIVAGDTASKLPSHTEVFGVDGTLISGVLTWYWDADMASPVDPSYEFSEGDISLGWKFVPQNPYYTAVNGTLKISVKPATDGGGQDGSSGSDGNGDNTVSPDDPHKGAGTAPGVPTAPQQKSPSAGASDTMPATGDISTAAVFACVGVSLLALIVGGFLRFRLVDRR